MADVSGVEPAPLRRRAGASGIDVLLSLSAIALVVSAYVGYMKRRDPEAHAQVLFSLMRAAALVLVRNSRSPGFRILGLRRVDARTGGPVSLRSALIRAGLSVGLRFTTSRWQPQAPAPGGAVRQAFGRVLLVFGALEAPALWSTRHQNVPDRLAGTVVIVED